MERLRIWYETVSGALSIHHQLRDLREAQPKSVKSSVTACVSQTKYQGPCGLSPGHQDLLLPNPVPRQAKGVEESGVYVLQTFQCLMILFLTTGPLSITF